MRKIILFLLFSLAVTLSSSFTCEKTEESGNVNYLSYGTSFGECLGYCVREIVVSGGATFTKSGWLVDETLPDSSCSIQFIMDPLPGYLEDIDLDEFLAMEEIIGCPDCADGGAEWLELGFEDQIKRVIFEYMNEPEEFEDVIPELRILMDTFNDCRSSR